jgi:hypothetical protein
MNNHFFNLLLLFTVLLAVPNQGQAQKLRLTGYGSYVLDGGYHIYYSSGSSFNGIIKKGLQTGLGLEYMVAPKYGVEFNLLKRNTIVLPASGPGNDRRSPHLGFNYFLLGINAYPQVDQRKLQVFGGVSTGFVIQSVDNTYNINSNAVYHSIAKFVWAGRVGGIIWLNTQVGIKLQAQWLSALQFKESMVNFDVSTLPTGPAEYTIANQFELGTGLIINFARPLSKPD